MTTDVPDLHPFTKLISVSWKFGAIVHDLAIQNSTNSLPKLISKTESHGNLFNDLYRIVFSTRKKKQCATKLLPIAIYGTLHNCHTSVTRIIQSLSFSIPAV